MRFCPDGSTKIGAVIVAAGGASTASARTSFALPERDRVVPERVVADRGEEVDLRAEPRRADRLVRALAAVVAAEGAADDRLPRLRHAVELDRQADPVAAHDRDPRHGAQVDWRAWRGSRWWVATGSA